jgi:hypothetical protein
MEIFCWKFAFLHTEDTDLNRFALVYDKKINTSHLPERQHFHNRRSKRSGDLR